MRWRRFEGPQTAPWGGWGFLILKARRKKREVGMRIIFDSEIEGDKVAPIGRIHAASSWHGPRSAVTEDFYKTKALENLIDVAEDCDADAIIEIDYGIDQADAGDTPGSSLVHRVSVTGLAVKLARP
jgi:uncharacterized protein YbjQ (UPF0145 family)